MGWNSTNRIKSSKPRKSPAELAAEMGGDAESVQVIGNNRVVFTAARKRHYVLHSTPVVTFDTKGQRAKISTGGYATATTAKAINEGLALFGVPGVVFRHGGEIYYRTREADAEPRLVDAEKGLSVAV